jgi:DNA-binding transcriptional MerR regulator
VSAVAAERTYRIGELAAAAGTTTRTVRYYEEIGLIPGAERRKGAHRLYTDADAERLRELVRLRDLLGVSLEELKTLVEAEEARAKIRARFAKTDDEAEKRDLAAKALVHVERQLALVRDRKEALGRLEAELVEKAQRIRDRLAKPS